MESCGIFTCFPYMHIEIAALDQAWFGRQLGSAALSGYAEEFWRPRVWRRVDMQVGQTT